MYKRQKPDNALLRFLLQHRLPQRYGSQTPGPGHPVYEAIRRDVLEAQRREGAMQEAAVYAALDAKIERIRARLVAAREDGSAPD